MITRLESPLAIAKVAAVTGLAGLLVGFASVIGPAIALAGSVALVLTALTLFDLTFGIMLVTVLTFFEAIPTFGGGVTFVKLVGAVVILSWLLLAFNRRSEIRLLPVDQPFFSYAVLALLAWAAASILWASDVEAATSYVVRFLLVVLLLFVTYSAVRGTRQLRMIVWAFAGGALATTIYGIVAGLSSKGDRLIGGIENPNDLAAGIVPAIVLWAALAITTRHGFVRALCFVSIGISVIALFLTQSRGGILGLAVALVVAMLIGGSLRGYAVALGLIVVAVGVGYYFTLSSPIERDRLVNISSEGSSGRTDEWKLAIRAARDHPLFGVGLDNFRTVQTRYVTDVQLVQLTTALKKPGAHNLYVQLLSELGIIGMLLHLTVLVSVISIGMQGVRRLARLGLHESETLGRGILIAIVSLLTIYVFYNGLLEKEFWLLTGLLVSLTAIAGQAESRPGSEQDPEQDQSSRSRSPVLVRAR